MPLMPTWHEGFVIYPPSKPQPIDHLPLHKLIKLSKPIRLLADAPLVVANEECEVEPKGIFDYGLDCFKFSFTEIVLVL